MRLVVSIDTDVVVLVIMLCILYERRGKGQGVVIIFMTFLKDCFKKATKHAGRGNGRKTR